MDYKEITNRIDELSLDGYKHIKNNDWGLPDKLADWLKERDFKKLGEGLYSSVFQSQTENFVVKINNGDIDEGYLEFLDFCRKTKSPHLPKIGTVKKYENWYIIFIEKLEPSNLSRWINTDLLNFFSSYRGDDWDSFEKVYNALLLPNGSPFNDDSVKKQFFELSNLVTLFEGYSDNGTIINDLHSNNIMMRGDTYVITDPIS